MCKDKKGFILYVDVLGYTNILKSKNKNDIDNLKNFINEFSSKIIDKKISFQFTNNYSIDKIIIRCFSDNFLIFYNDECNENNLRIILKVGAYLTGIAIKRGFLLRGSIVYGDLMINDRIVFGNTIVEAYELESKHLEPMLVLSSNLKELYENQKLYDEMLLSPFSSFKRNSKNDAKELADGIKILVDRLNYQSIVDERIILKYRWLIKEFNKYFIDVYGIEFMEEPSHYRIDDFEAI